ncbi:uncharacterized protein LOC110020801 [Phalaenopsis equestris]|uniref:uncharacterized protein LOC110020801 n=1 Tax=Phalaenopsis equestris TaxID=78828 RepID=UPI0009E3F66D|nr:uncharacterized protein LOC110020801 [Phalaenopsis equestris]
MGNCQAAETAAPSAEIEHPDGKKEKIYRSIIAGDIMSACPGYYVAVVTFSGGSGGETPAKHLSLLRPNDNLNIGYAYRLVSFEEVLREFGLRKRVRLSRLVERRKEGDEGKMGDGAAGEVEYSSPNVGLSTSYIGGRPNRSFWRQSQWKPTLPSIAELGI